MFHKYLTSLIVGSSLVLYPIISSAEYVIKLTNGREIHALHFVKEQDTYIIEMESGTIKIPSAIIKNIVEEQTPPEVVSTHTDEPPPPLVPSKAPNSHAGLAQLKRQRDGFQSQLDTLMAQYREALTTQDKEKQIELFEQITGTTRAYYSVNEQAAKSNGGTIPSDWEEAK